MIALRVAWITMRELIYERVFYLLLTFAVLALGFSLLLGQLTYSEQAKITLDFLLAAVEVSMVLFSVFMGIGLFKKELMLGSVAMVLSKPISRSSFLIGKYLGQVAIQFVVMFCMMLLTLAIQSNFQGDSSLLSVVQAVGLIFLEVLVLTAMAYFFAVNAGTITAAVVTLCLFAVGHMRESIVYHYNISISRSWIWPVIMSLIPDLEIFNMKTIASYGYTLDATQLFWAVMYSLCCAVFFLFVACVCFANKDIAT
ncbi:MAG: hypothetical protein R3B54_14075 [Bdellovibrionota bacterium]